jgi:hypothetical protein
MADNNECCGRLIGPAATETRANGAAKPVSAPQNVAQMANPLCGDTRTGKPVTVATPPPTTKK